MKSPPIDIVLEVEGAAKVKKNSKNREWREKRAEAKRRGGERETLGVMPLPATQIQVPTIRNPAQKERSGEKKAVDNRSRRPEGAVPRVVKTAGVIKLMVKMKTFGISALRRKMNSLWDEQRAEGGGHLVEPRRDSLDIKQMYDPEFLVAGEKELPPGAHPFKLDAMDQMHVGSCPECGETHAVRDDCYYKVLRRTITHGYRPQYTADIVKEYSTSGNNKLSAVFDKSFDAAVGKMVTEGVLRLWTVGSAVELFFINPMGIVIKNSDKARARIVTGVKIVDQKTLDEANEGLVKQEMRPVKTRVSMNNSANGGNRALLKPRFSYATSADATFLIQRNDYLGKGDVERYFLNFPLAEESYAYFGVRALGAYLYFVMVYFGLASAPYYTSVWGAEIRRWVMSKGVDAVHFVDDWWTVGRTLAEVKGKMDIIVAVLNAMGLTMAVDKFEFGQRLVFLGILYDTVAMTMAFDAVQCQVVALLLRNYRAKLVERKAIHYTDIVQLCGKLNWFGEILQAGRVHTAQWWRYSTLREGQLPSDELRLRLIADTDWWLKVVDKWAVGDNSEKAFPIVSAHEMLDDPDNVAMCCSDMSGPDGWGCFYGNLEEMNGGDPLFKSVRWEDSNFVPESSMWGELKALREYLDFPDRKGKMLVWVSDSLAGVWCINKGRAHSDGEVRQLVEEILERCDELRIVIVALWVPREENLFADYLSHLATSMDRHSVAGRCSALDDTGADH
jgi:hypothetical protein